MMNLQKHNELCEKMGNYEAIIYENSSDFLKDVFGDDVRAVAQAIVYGSYKLVDEYVTIDVYGHLQSYSSLERALKENCID